MPDTSLFAINLIPDVDEGGRTILSVCFELNREHPVLQGGQDENTKNTWKNDIKSFVDIISAISTDTGAKTFLKPTGFQITRVKPLRDPAKAVDTWCRYLGFQRVQNPGTRHPFDIHSKISVLSAQIRTSSSSPTIPPLLDSTPDKIKAHLPVKNTVTSNLGPLGAQKLADIGKAVGDNWGVDGIQRMPAADIKGIGKAFDEEREKHKRRNGLIATQHILPREKINSFKLKDEEANNSLVQNMTRLFLGVNTVGNEPPYIHAAIDHLNSQVSLRKFVGTIIELEVTGVTTPGTVSLDIDLTKDGGQLIRTLGLSANPYFAAGVPTNLDKLSLSPAKWVVQPLPIVSPMQDENDHPNGHQYSEYIANTLFKLKDKSQIVSFEPEQVGRNHAAVATLATTSDLANTPLNNAAFATTPTFGPGAMDQLAAQAAASTWLNTARRMNNQVGNVHTKGHSLYLSDPDFLQSHGPDLPSYYEHNLTAGYVVFVRIKDTSGNGVKLISDWTSISKVVERIRLKTDTHPPAFTLQQLVVSPHAAIHSSDEANVDTGIKNGFFFNWDGTIASARNPLHIPDTANQPQGTDKAVANAESLNGLFHDHLEFTALNVQTAGLIRTDWFPFKKWGKKDQPDILLERTFDKTAARLKFNSSYTYEYIAAIQYHNGYCPVTEDLLRTTKTDLTPFIASSKPFRRHEHISEPIVTFEENIYEDADHKIPKKGHLGETAFDLVVREGNLAHNDDCTRFIQPPAVPSFNTYLWYDISGDHSSVLSRRKMSGSTLFPWYTRYQCSYKSPDEFNASSTGCKGDCKTFCGGTALPTVYPGYINYLPDPIVTGFVVFFYSDRECLLPADPKSYPTAYCSFQDGSYPQLHPWKMSLIKNTRVHDQRRIDVIPFDQHIVIRLLPGEQLYAKMAPTFDKDAGHFYPSAFSHPGLEGTGPNGAYYNTLLSGMATLSFTHATQFPIEKPVIQSADLTRYSSQVPNRNAASLTLDLQLKYEHLNLWQQVVPIPGALPTGELDLYALWDDYSDNTDGPLSSIDSKRNRSLTSDGFVHVGVLDFNAAANNGSAYNKKLVSRNAAEPNVMTGIIRFELENSFQTTGYVPITFRIRNTSKYARYFTAKNIDEAGNEILKESFSVWSDEFFAPDPNGKVIHYGPPNDPTGPATTAFLLNNKKPSDIKVRKIVPLKVTDHQHDNIQVRGNRLRIYLEPKGIRNAGKDGRLGIVLADKDSCYKNFLSPFASKAGRDAVTDDPGQQLDLDQDCLKPASFLLAEDPGYVEKFKPKYYIAEEGGIGHNIGLMSYLLHYDGEQQLWYVDIALDLTNKDQKELHNPFVQLFVVNHQPFSANYNELTRLDNEAGYKLDNRVSNVTALEFVCIYPKREIKNPLVLFRKHKDYQFELTGDISSLFFQHTDAGTRLATQFVLVMQRRMEGGLWGNIESTLENDKMGPTQTYHSLLPYDLDAKQADGTFSTRFKMHFKHNLFESFRGVIYEVEFFNPHSSATPAAPAAGATNPSSGAAKPPAGAPPPAGTAFDNSILDHYLSTATELSHIDGVRIKDIIIIDR